MPVPHDTAGRTRHLGSGEGDSPVLLTGPRDWLVVLVVVALVVGGAFWGVTASLPRSATAAGLITYPDGAFVVQTPVGGMVTDVLVHPGDRVQQGAQLALINNAGVSTAVPSPKAGHVFSVPARVGQLLGPGSVVMSAEQVTATDTPVAVVFLPATVPATVTVGAPVQLTVPSAPMNQFGVLLGRVLSVDPMLSTRQEILDFVGDSDLAGQLAGTGGARRVVVGLDTAPTPSGYRWSTGQGPPFSIPSRTVLVANLPQPPMRPIQWVVPG